MANDGLYVNDADVRNIDCYHVVRDGNVLQHVAPSAQLSSHLDTRWYSIDRWRYPPVVVERMVEVSRMDVT